MTSNQDKRKTLLAGLHPLLKENGFRKKAFTFRRETETGLIQVIELRLGPSWGSKAGEVELEFGIFSVEWHELLGWGQKMPATLRPPHCEIRDSGCQLVKPSKWYNLTNDPDEIVHELLAELREHILPFLDQHRSRRDILESYARVGEGIGLPPRHRLSVAVLNYGAGNLNEALAQLNEVSEEHSESSFYQDRCEKLRNAVEKAKAQQQG